MYLSTFLKGLRSMYSIIMDADFIVKKALPQIR